MSDTLSDVLRAVRLTGAVFFSVDASAPWVAEAPRGCVVGPHIMPGVEHVIEYHVVSGGSCWASLLDEPPIQLHEGDIVVFPQGDAHVMSSAPGMRGEPDPELFVRAGQSRLPLAMSMQGGGVERARLVCGFLGCDARPYNPLLAALPRVIHLPASVTSESVARRLVELAVAESNAREAGAECLLARLSELLFIEVVRRYAASMPSEGVGWFSALRDPQIGQRSRHVSLGVGRALLSLRRRAADSVPRQVAHSARGLALARRKRQLGRDRRPRGLRLGSRIEPRVQALGGRGPGVVPARRARDRNRQLKATRARFTRREIASSFRLGVRVAKARAIERGTAPWLGCD
jgi:hypothetical protein